MCGRTMKIVRREFSSGAAEALITQGVRRLAAQVLAARGITKREDITPSPSSLPPPEDFNSAMQVADFLAHSIKSKKRICVIGDYDADGMTATALAADALRRMGADAFWLIPSRADGYGLSENLVAEAAAGGAQTLLTVDNGVSANDAIRAAKQAGMTVLITDHHLGGDCEAADALAHPHGESSAFAGLAGVGVAFYVAAALKKIMGAELPMGEYLDLVALGTVADRAPMNAINRTLAAAGIARLRRGGARAGLMRLAETANCDIPRFNGRDLAFRIAPRINAAGRLGNVAAAMKNLLARSDDEARTAAAVLDELNRRRAEIQRKTLHQARAALPSPLPAGIVAANRQWHEGIVGVVAGSLSEEENRPAVVFTAIGDGGGDDWKGSGRAPPGWDLYAIAEAAHKARPELLPRFGGHRRAVGFSLCGEPREFAELFAEICGATAPADSPPCEVDELPPLAEITAEAVAQLENIVWGEGFPAPLFTANFAVLSERALRGGHRALSLATTETGNGNGSGNKGNGALRAVQFNVPPTGENAFSALFRLSAERNGNAQLILEKTFSPR